MSKWTSYQLLIGLTVVTVIFLNQLFYEQVLYTLDWLSGWIMPAIAVIFLSIVLIVWSCASILLLQLKKGKQLFIHKVWRIMPAIIGAILFISLILFIVLGTIFITDIPKENHWLIDSSVLYFLTLFYGFVLSIFVRYSNYPTNEKKIVFSAHTTIAILLFVILFLPSL